MIRSSIGVVKAIDILLARPEGSGRLQGADQHKYLERFAEVVRKYGVFRDMRTHRDIICETCINTVSG
jgi:hypothetical protein